MNLNPHNILVNHDCAIKIWDGELPSLHNLGILIWHGPDQQSQCIFGVRGEFIVCVYEPGNTKRVRINGKWPRNNAKTLIRDAFEEEDGKYHLH